MSSLKTVDNAVDIIEMQNSGIQGTVYLINVFCSLC